VCTISIQNTVYKGISSSKNLAEPAPVSLQNRASPTVPKLLSKVRREGVAQAYPLMSEQLGQVKVGFAARAYRTFLLALVCQFQ